MPQFVFHLLGNAHLDPVWLWDWREGLNEGLITCRTILDLMDEDPELTFCRGEAAIYQHIEITDPPTFARIRARIAEGRWEVIGGTMLQPDTNLPATETFARHFLHGQDYFTRTFGSPVRVAWAADSFGHAAGLPDIMAAAGINFFAFTRPDPKTVPLAKPAFWWQGPGEARILSYRPPMGWYGTEHDEPTRRLDGLLAEAIKGDLKNVGVFYGLGDHGGGPTRRQLADIRQWAAAHPEVKVMHSGMHRFFGALQAEIAHRPKAFLPTHLGELNFCLRGCYASVAKFKYAYRHTEALVQRAENTDATISAALDRTPADTGSIWDSVLFNSFHDILPGTSIERAMEEQIAWLCGAQHESRRIELSALNALASQIDTRVRKPRGHAPSGVSALVWNPHPHPFEGPLEIEACMDYRPIPQYRGEDIDKVPLELLGPAGKPLRFQCIATEHSTMTDIAWRKRVVAPLKIPAFGWSMLEFAWVEGARAVQLPQHPASAPKPGVIDNGIYRVEASAGNTSIHVWHKGKALFAGKGLSAVVFDDPWGAWGGMGDEPDALKQVKARETWHIDRVETMESGPERAMLWVRFAGKQSWLTLTIALSADRAAVDVAARVLWNERSARLKLVMPGASSAEFDVPGASVKRQPSGEVPGGRWVKVHGPADGFGFASDSLYAFDCTNGQFRATIARASRYANSTKTDPKQRPWLPAADCGELKFKFLFAPNNTRLPILAGQLEQAPVVLLVPQHNGSLPRQGSLASLTPDSLQLLTFKRARDGRGFIVRCRETQGRSVKPRLTWMGQAIALDPVKANSIATWRLIHHARRWRAIRSTILED